MKPKLDPKAGWRPVGVVRGLMMATAFCFWAETPALAAPLALPLEFRQSEVFFNLQSQRGVPISTVINLPPGSDGRMPTTNESSTLNNPPTTNQFRTFVTFGGVAAPTNQLLRSNDFLLNGTNAFSGNVAIAMQLPVGRADHSGAGAVLVALRRAQVGAPYLSRQVSFLFGSEITAPDTNERGTLLSNVTSVAYWLPEPYSTNSHTNAAYYWSEHAGKVYAVQPGPIQVTWRKAAAFTAATLPPDYTNALGSRSFESNGANIYLLYTANYVVSGSAVKPPRKIYWTEGQFGTLGKPIDVPEARIAEVQVVYNQNFPKNVPRDQVIFVQGEESFVTNRTDQTLWYDTQQKKILARNREGRVFVELLGELKPTGESRQQLGFEIVDVYKEPSAFDVTIELGERITPPPPGSLVDLFPEEIAQNSGNFFSFQQNVAESGRIELYATRETSNLNDYMVHWMEAGVQGLKWPSLFARYAFVWPNDIAKYRHYIRPLAATEAEARQTAVPLPTANVPFIDYQDQLDKIRGKLTDDFKFYTFLTPQFPAHRTLLRFTAGENVAFERVFSWLDANLRATNNFSNSVATTLTAWRTNLSFHDIGPGGSPRLINATAHVGQRLAPPPNELGAGPGDEYFAGYIRQSEGTSFSASAYVDPFASGFEAAKSGAIIPINALGSDDRLEVWWFRSNGADTQRGFKPIYWPSVIGRYTLAWPPDPPEIILASNDGSGPLNSFEARGSLYIQNDRNRPGYNPNEEHALLQGGQVYALRDDLNLTEGTSFSSQPFVLLEYEAADERPAITAFKVLREKPEAGIVFNYAVSAGTILQPPMPLPLLEKPLLPRLIGQAPLSLNHEVPSWTVSASIATNLFYTIFTNDFLGVPVLKYSDEVNFQRLTTVERHYFTPYRLLPLQFLTSIPTTNYWLYVLSSSFDSKSLAGLVTPNSPRSLSRYTNAQPALPYYRFTATNLSGLILNTTVMLVDELSRANGFAVLRGTDSSGYVEVEFAGSIPPAITNANLLIVPLDGTNANTYFGWKLGGEAVPAGIIDPTIRSRFASFTLQDRKGDLWVYRGPHDPANQPELFMRFYYKTLPGFFFPRLPLDQQPRPGTITPYLRQATSNGFAENEVLGDQDDNRIGDDNALGIRYRPVWPQSAPVLHMAETLTLPKRGLPSVRGQTSLEILYQQSQAEGNGNVNRRSVVLHDPTREKIFRLVSGDATRLDAIPGSAQTSAYLGKIFFPALPPHLAERFFFDPTRGPAGALVFKGQFTDAPLGEDYVLLNVIAAQDAAYLKDLCHSNDLRKASWDAAITNGLVTTMQLFTEDPERPGTFIPTVGFDKGPAEIANVENDDIAVDSYALSAVGPGTGYVTLISGNGLAFTPGDEPVSVQVIKVVSSLYRGEVKVIESSNPLNEKLTLQQVADLAAQAGQYAFEWKIAVPVDGFPPTVYSKSRRSLLGDEGWTHVRFPLETDLPGNIHNTNPGRTLIDVVDSVIAVSRIDFNRMTNIDSKLHFRVDASPGHGLVGMNRLNLRNADGFQVSGTVQSETLATNIVVRIDPFEAEDENVPALPDPYLPVELFEQSAPGRVQSMVFRNLTFTDGTNYSEFWLTLDLGNGLGARVFIDGQLAVTAGMGAEDTPTTAAPPDLQGLSRAYRLLPEVFSGGSLGTNGIQTNRLAVQLFSQAVPGTPQTFRLHLDVYDATDETAIPGSSWLPLDSARYLDGVRAILGGNADVRSLSDNYLIMRYWPTNTTHVSYGLKSQWTEPQLAEGWIKRVLRGINPYNQRVADLFNNRVNTDASVLTQAGKRWEGDVALNLDSINDYGLIEIYETVLRRGRMLSIDSGINYGPANDALLLAAGYLNDLYMMIGNEAWADASNPTIGIGTKDRTYGEIATALFAFKGQTASLLEEELALLRGRDDFLQPGVKVAPVYNRLVWNYTRGIDAGEVIYALNYNIQENPDSNPDGVINAEDAQRMFPQGHGDAYGHYLTAIKGYYSLLLNDSFDWVPRIEAVTVLGQPVSVDYQDERKFAAAASALARAGKQVFDLTWRRDYESVKRQGWEHFAGTRSSHERTRFWSLDHWASRASQGTYLNWVAGNAIIPAVDPDPTHEGIQKIDRTTIPELAELASIGGAIQTALNNAEAGLSPLGVAEDAIAFDINPNAITGTSEGTHFEQIYSRAKLALNNAMAAFDDAKDVTRLMRSEQDSLADFQGKVAEQEAAFNNALVEIYGTPYPDDIGPGKTYRQGYDGPDLLHYQYVNLPESTFNGLLKPTIPQTNRVDIQKLPPIWVENVFAGTSSDLTRRMNDLRASFDSSVHNASSSYALNTHYVEFVFGPHGFFDKPSHWTSKRQSPGRIQQAISDLIKSHDQAAGALRDGESAKKSADRALSIFKAVNNTKAEVREFQEDKLLADQVQRAVEQAFLLYEAYDDITQKKITGMTEKIVESIPKSTIAGLAAGGDLTSVARGSVKTFENTVITVQKYAKFVKFFGSTLFKASVDSASRAIDFYEISSRDRVNELRGSVQELSRQFGAVAANYTTINQRLRELDDAERELQALIAEGEGIQQEREIARQRAAAVIQGFRTRDAAFRIFRNEKLERYKTLFDLAARYSLLAANAYDYETGLLNSSQSQQFVGRIVNSRALGVVRDGQPQYAGSNTGDPGLSSALAEMKADWDVVRGRLGFNNPDAYGTTLSLRTENFRILPTPAGSNQWMQILQQARKDDLLEDADVRRYCMQINNGNGLPVPGLVITFSTTIQEGQNLFGLDLAGGDHAFSPSSFATKIFAVGVALEGYRGMENPTSLNLSNSVSDPSLWFLDPLSLSATPYIYLIPVGQDVMRTPPLGDVSELRTWKVADVTIPLPFNIGASGFSENPYYLSSDSLTEPLFSVRKHQAFRPVSSTGFFSQSLYGSTGSLLRSQYTNNRLVGRSAWNTQWKLVIPARTLLHDPNEGLERFVHTVRDIKLHFVTYSYSGN